VKLEFAPTIYEGWFGHSIDPDSNAIHATSNDSTLYMNKNGYKIFNQNIIKINNKKLYFNGKSASELL
jgi:hypothetical protein